MKRHLKKRSMVLEENYNDITPSFHLLDQFKKTQKTEEISASQKIIMKFFAQFPEEKPNCWSFKMRKFR